MAHLLGQQTNHGTDVKDDSTRSIPSRAKRAWFTPVVTEISASIGPTEWSGWCGFLAIERYGKPSRRVLKQCKQDSYAFKEIIPSINKNKDQIKLIY